MSMDIKAVKDKIKKLLALSADNPSDEESYSALQKAQELMAKYKLSKDDITDEEKERCIRRKTELHYGSRSSDHYIYDLATIIADNFCCVNYCSTPYNSRTHSVWFMGMKDDVDIATEVLYSANAAIVRGYNRVYRAACKEYGIGYLPAKIFNALKLGYIEGYLAGLRKALESQREANQEWGLVLVAPQEAKDFIGGLKVRDFGQVQRVDMSYYEEGYNDGSNFNMSKKIDSSENLRKISD